MTIAVSGFLGPVPSTGALIRALLLTVLAYAVLRYTERAVMPLRPLPARTPGPLRTDAPAVVNMLTNDATLTAAGFRATVIDLGARGWLRLLPPTTDDEVGRVRPAANSLRGDSLLPHERLVLQHIMARFTTDHAIPAQHLAVDVRGSWWKRFNGLVSDEAHRSGLLKTRWTLGRLAPPIAFTTVAAFSWWLALQSADDGVAVVDSFERRIATWILFFALAAMTARIVFHAVRRELTHTQAGLVATERWLAVRERLVEGGFGMLAPSSIEVGDRRLAYASAMCLAEGASIELPLAREDHYRAWSSVGGTGRLVRIRYPSRVGYGLHPIAAIVIGIVAVIVGVRGRRWFADVARMEAWESIYERFPDQDWLIADIATGLAAACFIPILLGVWVAFAGAADVFTTTERTGVVLRTRRPAEVVPLPRPLRRMVERDRFTIYMAVDDGADGTVVAWRSSERHAVPQGASAIVKATPVLGYVRKATPVGHRLPD
ncbi:MAG: hypothetical protein QNM02_13345 [Acidimicrobiia bacterium]|nr:hypothetical protein [Acidimicrobiia bacterium]